MSWLALLNPLNWFKFAGIIESIIAFIENAVKTYRDWQTKKEQDAAAAAMKKATDDLKNATTSEEKVNAACEIEKVLNPDADCDPKPRG